jgi:hypothetical protein
LAIVDVQTKPFTHMSSRTTRADAGAARREQGEDVRNMGEASEATFRLTSGRPRANTGRAMTLGSAAGR